MPSSDTVQPVARVIDVIDIVREWVTLHASLLPNFAGAYLWGGITSMAPDAPFHLYRDVDVVVVFTHGAPDEEQEVFYRGLILEVIPKNLDEHHDVEAVLVNPSAGPNLATTQILADPTGILTPLHHAVAADYAQRRWIQARCEAEKRMAQESLTAVQHATTPQERLDSVRGFLGALSGLLAVAQLKRPTTRRTLALLQELLDAQGRSDLNEAALTVMGSAHMSRADVEAILDGIMPDFDRAVEVNRTPIPYGFAIRAHIRPYYLDGSREMIAEGQHREALYWIACLDIAYLILQNDAPEAEKPAFAARYHAFQTALGYTSAEQSTQRLEIAARLLTELVQLADSLVALQPD